ncbi:MAG: succinate dehydrogenase, cytochrome b556 subunit [Pseudomonadaceae bacterium]|nr:succinate dehydrogenase, cytochrome b556 subunit [Pseudomonadaceae bacterium]
MKTDRPVNLALYTIHFPVTAVASITHRITGVILMVGIGFGLWLLDLALSSEAGYLRASEVMQGGLAKFILWGLLASVIYHVCAGLKHLLLDMHIADSLEGGRIATWAMLVISAVLVVLAGVWVW